MPIQLSFAYVARATPMILNMMDITPDLNAIAYGWKVLSFEFDCVEIQGRATVGMTNP